MTSTVTKTTLFIGVIFIFVEAIHGLCTIPSTWVSAAWAVRPKATIGAPDANTWIMYYFPTSDTLANLETAERSTCLDLTTLPLGFTMLYMRRNNDNARYCILAKRTVDVLWWRQSVISTSNPPNSIAECTEQAGLDNSIIQVLIRVPTPTAIYTYSHAFTTLPSNAQFSLAIKTGLMAYGCVNDASSTFTRNNQKFTAASTCISTTKSYNNPLAEDLWLLESITDSEISATGSANNGYMVMVTRLLTAASFDVGRVYVMRYMYTTEDFKISMETGSNDQSAFGYAAVSLITSGRTLEARLTSRGCITGNTCLNGATCVAGLLATSCSCTSDYQGATCSQVIDKCSPNPCLNNGVCSQIGTVRTCTCTGTSYVGTNCEMLNKCAGAGAVICANGGTCTTYTNQNGVVVGGCTCVSPWEGATCSVFNPCATNQCLNGGQCMPKVNALTAADFFCLCASNFFGDKCQNAGAGPCGSNPCGLGGTCQAVGSSFQCTCRPGYTGNTCQASVANCAANPCKNGGKCSAIGAGVYCECTSYYGGAYCEAYQDWFIILLVLIILVALILFILTIVCACYCCCGWRPGKGNSASYDNYGDKTNQAFSTYSAPAQPIGDTVQFNFVPRSQYMGMSTR